MLQDHIYGFLEVIVEAESREEVNVHEKDVGRGDLAESDVAQVIDGVKLALAIHHVVGDVTARAEGVGRKGVSVMRGRE